LLRAAVLRRKSHLLGEDRVRARTDLDFPGGGISLSLFVKRHDGIARGATPCTALAMAAMWAGVVPQHPPTMWISPLRAHSPICAPMISGVSS
jgi:hypothetical protein